MELCGASLHDIIEEPENMYGLEDITLINIIRDICKFFLTRNGLRLKNLI